MKPASLSASPCDGHQQRTNPTEANACKTKQEVVPLVFGPVLKCLGLFGYPVPVECSHVNTPLHDTKRGSQNKEKVLQDLKFKETSDNTLIQVDQQKTSTDSPTVTQTTRNQINGRGGNSPVSLQNETNELVLDDATITTTKHTDEKTICKSNKQGDEVKTKVCKKCHRKKRFRKCVFLFFIMMYVANMGRYTTTFTFTMSVDTGLVFSIISIASYGECLFMYVASYHSLSTQLPHLLQLLQVYDDNYSVRIDCQRMSRRVKHIIFWNLFLQIAMTAIVSLGMLTCLPSLKIFLKPFHEIEGPGLYAIAGVLGLSSVLSIFPLTTLILFTLIGTILLVKEYQYVTRQMALLFRSQEDSLQDTAQHHVDSSCSESDQSASGRDDGEHVDSSNRAMPGNISDNDVNMRSNHSVKTHVSWSHTFSQHRIKESERSSSTHDSIHSGHASKKAEDWSFTKKTYLQEAGVATSKRTTPSHNTISTQQSTHQSVIQSRAEGISRQPGSPTDSRKHATHAVKQMFVDQTIHLEDIEEAPNNGQDSNQQEDMTLRDEGRQIKDATENSDSDHPEHMAKGRLPQRGPRRLKLTEEALHRIQARREGTDWTEESEEGHLQDLEDVFDHLCGQHQLLRAILQRFRGCLTHVISVGFSCNMLTFFILIYGLGNPSARQADVAGFGLFLVETILGILSITLLGILVNDHAHAVQEVIYAADWSQFSDRLLTKVQLFASRLGHSKIGFDVYGLFVIDRSTVLMVAGTLLTYTVVVIQFQQAEVSHCANTTAPS